MKKLHAFALSLALGHFALSGILAGIVLSASIGYGMSDAYEVPALGFVAADRSLQLLEAPVVAVLKLLYHPKARFEPPNLFAVDILQNAKFLVVVGLSVVWSLGFGYLAAFLASLTKSRKSKGFRSRG
jgi:hypothetical protein